MHLKPIHAEHHLPTLHAFIRSNPLGLLTTALPSQTYPLLQTSHVPFLLDVPNANDNESSESKSELGVLRAHMARANPQVKAMIEELTRSDSPAEKCPGGGWLEKEVLILFNGPVHHYVTPKFYKETKPATGKVVPTWDYAAVEVYGRARVLFDGKDAATDAFLERQIGELSAFCEGEVMGYREKPWELSDAPRGYLEVMKKGIVGVEIVVDRVGGRVKMSQEMKGGDHEGVVEGFEGLGTEVGREMAAWVRARGKKGDE